MMLEAFLGYERPLQGMVRFNFGFSSHLAKYLDLLSSEAEEFLTEPFTAAFSFLLSKKDENMIFSWLSWLKD